MCVLFAYIPFPFTPRCSQYDAAQIWKYTAQCALVSLQIGNSDFAKIETYDMRSSVYWNQITFPFYSLSPFFSLPLISTPHILLRLWLYPVALIQNFAVGLWGGGKGWDVVYTETWRENRFRKRNPHPSPLHILLPLLPTLLYNCFHLSFPSPLLAFNPLSPTPN